MPLHRRMRSLGFSEFEFADSFWKPRLELLSKVTLPQQFDQIAHKTGRLENFLRVGRGETGGHQGRYYDDSDVYKWLEAVAYALKWVDHSPLKEMADTTIRAILDAQDESGYIDTYFQLMHPAMKLRNLSMMHEMYCMGHFLEAAVAWNEALSDRRLLDAAIKTADLLVREFGEGSREGYCGHEEIELALIRLGNHVGKKSYIDLAKRMIDLRGGRPSIFEAELGDEEAMKLSPWAKAHLVRDGNYAGDYVQDHAPIRDHRIVVGHAVRAMYLYTGAVQVANNDSELESALRSVWGNMTGKRMYITGGIGSTARNEGFTRDYDLPNLNSYAETCAAVGLALWGKSMLEHTGESDFSDTMERAIFNGAISGISLSGDHYFYANPLESRGEHARVPWFECACCPPNIARMIGSIQSFAYSVGEDGLWVHFPISGTIRTSIGGNDAVFEIKAHYPWTGKFTITYKSAPAKFAIRVRMPEWSDDAETELPGAAEEAEFESGYMVFDRQWKTGDSLTVDWNAEPKWIEANPNLFDNIGRLAMLHGPLVYCLEQLEGQPPAQWCMADPDSEPVVEFDAKLLCGVNVIEIDGSWLQMNQDEPLYLEAFEPEMVDGKLSFIPYYAWGNRGSSSMVVWVR